jgi:uncharacterized protein
MALPILQLNEIPADGLHLECEVQPDELALSPDDACTRDGLSLSADLMKAGAAVHVTGRLHGVIIRECVRCLKEYDDALDLPLFAEYRKDPQPAKRTSRTMEEGSGRSESVDTVEEEDDVYIYSGEELDLTGMLREQIILATPMQPVCHHACVGLCPVCGQDRNERPCGCPEQPQESPFAVLRKLREAVEGNAPHAERPPARPNKPNKVK